MNAARVNPHRGPPPLRETVAFPLDVAVGPLNVGAGLTTTVNGGEVLGA